MGEPMLTHNRFAERLRADHATLAIVDGQDGLLPTEALRNNLLGLARLGHAFGVPTVLGICGAPKRDPLLDELLTLFGAQAVVRRAGGEFWNDAASRQAVLRPGRPHLIVAALTADFGLAEVALGARREGLEVHAVLDASAGSEQGAARIGLARMTAAGVHLTSWVAILAELAATGVDTTGGNGSAAVRDNLDYYATGGAGNASVWGDTSVRSIAGR